MADREDSSYHGALFEEDMRPGIAITIFGTIKEASLWMKQRRRAESKELREMEPGPDQTIPEAYNPLFSLSATVIFIASAGLRKTLFLSPEEP